jgi:hypothetical protein
MEAEYSCTLCAPSQKAHSEGIQSADLFLTLGSRPAFVLLRLMGFGGLRPAGKWSGCATLSQDHRNSDSSDHFSQPWGVAKW